MAIFGKSDQLSFLIKKIQTTESFGAGELDLLLMKISESADFFIEKHAWMLTHANRKIRACAAQHVQQRQDPALADLIMKEMLGRPSEVRSELARLVVRVGPDRVRRSLGTLIHSSERKNREIAIDLIGQSDELGEYLGYLKAGLRDPEVKIRHRSVRVLAQDVKNQTVFMILRNLVNDEDQVVREVVIEALAQEPQMDIIEPFFERLPHERLEVQSLITKALRSLARSGNQAITDRLLPILADESASMRDLAVKLLREVTDTTDVLRRFMLHSRGLAFWLRERSFETISRVADDLTDSLIVLLRDPEDDVRVGAMSMAKGSSDPRLLSVIVEVFESKSDWWVRGMAAEMMGNFHDENVTEILLSRIHDPELAYSVVSALSRHQNPLAMSALLQRLHDSSPGIRHAAVSALAGHPSPDVIVALVKVVQGDAEDRVRDQALEVLRGFGSMAAEALAQVERQERALAQFEEAAVPVELRMENETLN